MAAVTIRAYGPLNDFLVPGFRQCSFAREVALPASVKDVVEGAGIPHPEIGVVAVNGEPRDFSAIVAPGDRVAVYPWLASLEASGLPALRARLPCPPRFQLDTHLGKLARRLRLAGFDSLYDNAADDVDLAERAGRDDRVLLTRDVELLKRRTVQFGYFVRATAVHQQWLEVSARFDLAPVVRPFTRCTRCNGQLRPTADPGALARVPADVLARGPGGVAERPPAGVSVRDVHKCESCGHVYWEGSHTARIRAWMDSPGCGASIPTPWAPTRAFAEPSCCSS